MGAPEISFKVKYSEGDQVSARAAAGITA